jgi:general secretion pathway protein F
MAAYEYTALDASGRQRRGVLEADSGRQIRQMLRDQGLVPLAVDQAAEKSRGARGSAWGFRRGMSTLDQALFTRQLATLIAAGLPIEEALRAAAQQTEKRHVNVLIMGIRSRVLEGRSLAASLGDFPNSFSDLYTSTVTAGEQSGHLDSVLNNLADYTERRFESRRNVEMALFYPVILFLLAVAIVGALLVYVVPDIVRVFENTGQALPWLTAALIGLSEFVRSYAWLLIAGAVGLVFLARAVSPTRFPPRLGPPSAVPAPDQTIRASEQCRALRRHPQHPVEIGRAARRGDEHRGARGVESLAAAPSCRGDAACQRGCELAHRTRVGRALSADDAAHGGER